MIPNHIVSLLLVAVIAWRMYMRLRRNIGRQLLLPKLLKARIIIFSVVTCALAVFSLINLRLLMGLGAGLVLGMPLALVGLKLTKIEATPEGRFYTPNTSIGVALTIMLVGRLVYRMMVLFPMSRNSAPPQDLMQSGLSFFVFGLLAGYYMAYYVGVLSRKSPDQG